MKDRPFPQIYLASLAYDLEGFGWSHLVRRAIRTTGCSVMSWTRSGFGDVLQDNLRHVAEADAFVVVLASDYGWIPPEEQGGDGRWCAARFELETARQAGRPVFAFLLEEDAEWSFPAADESPDGVDHHHGWQVANPAAAAGVPGAAERG